MEATARIFFLKAPAKRTVDKKCPVKLCVTYRGERRYYSLVKWIKNNDWLFLSEEDIEKVTAKTQAGEYKNIRYEYDRIENEARKVITDMKNFSFNLFEEKYLDKVQDWDNIFTAMWSHIQDLKSEGRIGYASSFESTLRAIKEYHTQKTFKFNPRRDKVETRKEIYTGGKALNFIDITPAWLKKFEKWLTGKKKKRSTIGIHERNIRTLFNVATKEHNVKAEYPFDKFTPKSGKGKKIALTADQINKIATYKTDHQQEQFYRDIFMFSFSGCGMNLADLSRLKYSDIDDGEICFVREKTKDEEAEENTLRVPITKTMQATIDRHGNKAIGFDAYIFPIMKPDWSEERKYAEVKQLTKQVNKYLSRIGKAVGINQKISSYVARHSWSTISKNSGASIEFISEALGHSSTIVTKKYLKSFEKSTRKDHSKNIEDAVYNTKAV